MDEPTYTGIFANLLFNSFAGIRVYECVLNICFGWCMYVIHVFVNVRKPLVQLLGWYLIAYGVALVSRIDKIIGLSCKRALSKRHMNVYNVHCMVGVCISCMYFWMFDNLFFNSFSGIRVHECIQCGYVFMGVSNLMHVFMNFWYLSFQLFWWYTYMNVCHGGIYL